jgi:hypothetical protein
MKWLSTRTCGLICTAGVVLFFTGCGTQGTVAGKVSLDGKPLPGGVVNICDSEGQTRTAGISKEGTYSVSNLAPGKAQISVLTLGERPSLREPEGRTKDSLGTYVAIPAKYMDKDQSGLGLDVKTGKQEFDIQLKGDAK